MKIIVVGLGLIGGSFCKAISAKTNHICCGIDRNPETIRAALKDGAIQKEATRQDLSDADLTLVCLHPEQTIAFILEHAKDFKPGSIVSDVCGVKQAVLDAVSEPLKKCGVFYIGTHPMAGREFSGYEYSLATLFHRASFILVRGEAPYPPQEAALKQLADDLGFEKTVISTAQEHDRIIAYTSQLAHIVSNAYVKSPTLHKRVGFSAGSFLDLTRVAKLNESMWTSLFLLNREPLLYEIDQIMEHLEQYRTALKDGDADTLKALLKAGRELKEESLKEGQTEGM